MSSTDPRDEARQERAVQAAARAHGFDPFIGDFESLPLLSHFECGPVPVYPTSDDFQLAAMEADHSAAHRWRCEAIRFRMNRRHHGSLGPTELRAIAGMVAAVLHRKRERDS